MDDSLNRNLKLFVGLLVVILDKVFHWQMPESVQLMILGMITAAVTLSNVKTMAQAKAKAAAEVSASRTPEQIAANLGGEVVK